ncbi:MAG: hypothetical protein JWQ89_280 [Devosia sp.]|uniref:hypothetical protein n=1 Tax=Devosia sp. TaxID=1871048 RepID=UPI0026181418|nr:hypothetical protein [Devosia sp.]MDB5538553.1 hypothetical protein [Devosia sp.]
MGAADREAGTPRPAVGGQNELFQIQEDIFVAEPLILGTVCWALGQSIVPMVALEPGENPRMRCLGTGFFISCSGLLVTAAHVITDPIERGYGRPIETTDLNCNCQASASALC